MLGLSVAVVYLALVAQVPPAPPLPPPQFGQTRDPRSIPEATGTGIVRGRVVTADGRAVKRVVVTLVQTVTADAAFDQMNRPSTRPVSQTTSTDAHGQFQFEHVPAGFYRLSARPGPYQAQYLMGALGQKRPDAPGLPFELSDGQVLSGATIVMPRSGVVTGRVTDDEGEPIARVAVSTMLFAPGASTPARTAGGQTDDLGRYRIFGLPPGDYLIFADVRNNFGMDPDADPTGFMTTYFPGVPSESEAQRIQIQSGAETSGVDFRLLRGRLFTVSGTVLNSQGQPVFRANVLVTRDVGRPEPSMVNGSSTDPQGHFTVRGLAAGDYKLAIRPRIAPQATVRIDGQQLPDMPEFGSVDLHVDSDINDLVLTTRPTLSIAGRVVFAEGLPPATADASDPLRRIRITAAAALGTTFSPPSTVELAPDLTFLLNGLSSAVVVRVNGLPANFVVRQVLVGTEDITDRGHEFVDRDSGQLQIVVTSRVAGLEGTVADAAGKPAVDSLVLLLLEPENGRHAALYRSGTVDPNGRFRLPALRAGQFLIVAIPRDRMPRNGDTTAYDAVAKDAQRITFADGEFKVLDLKVSGGG